MYFAAIIPSYLLVLLLCKEFSSAGDPERISLNAHVFDEKPEGQFSQQPDAHQPPLKISTGRMKPITSSGSPRVQDTSKEVFRMNHKQIKGLAISAVSTNPSATSDYPKVTVRPGKKDATVISYFHHPFRMPHRPNAYQYMQDEKHDDISDISQPAKKYQIGLRKTNYKSDDIRHAQAFTGIMSNSQYHPKAALVHIVPGDKRAKRKRPTIDVDQGRLHGNLLITSYGPESPKKHVGSSVQHQAQAHTSGHQSQHNH